MLVFGTVTIWINGDNFTRFHWMVANMNYSIGFVKKLVYVDELCHLTLCFHLSCPLI